MEVNEGGARASGAAEPGAVVYPDNLAALGVCRGLGAMGVPVTVLSSERGSPGQYSRYGRPVACPAMTDQAGFLAFLVDLGRAQRQRPVLFLTDDAAIMAVHPHRESLEQWYRFPMAPWPVLRQLMLKNHLYQSLAGIVPVPRTRVPVAESELAAAAQEIGYPAVVKPLLRHLTDPPDPSHPPFDKCFGAKALRVRTLGELTDTYRAARARGFRVVVQEEIEGPIPALYSLGFYASREGTIAAIFTSQKLCQVPSDFGDALVVKAAWAPELIPLGERVVRHFGYYGMADVEFKWDARAAVYKLLDFNPRPWPWINLPTVCGVNLAYATYLDVLGRPIDQARFAQRDFETRWVSVQGLLVHLIRCVLAPRPRERFLTPLRHCQGRRVGPLLSAEDFLFRMFLSPAYWRDALRQAAGGIKHLRMPQQV